MLTYLCREQTRWTEVGMRHLEAANAADRMWKEPRHGADLAEIRRRLAGLEAKAA